MRANLLGVPGATMSGVPDRRPVRAQPRDQICGLLLPNAARSQTSPRSVPSDSSRGRSLSKLSASAPKRAARSGDGERAAPHVAPPSLLVLR